MSNFTTGTQLPDSIWAGSATGQALADDQRSDCLNWTLKTSRWLPREGNMNV
jgi:hypothetical protein